MLAVALLSVIALAGARVYEKCELARELSQLGVDKEHVATWVCIAFHESRFDTAARNPHSGDHGLLQISELYWCGPGKACGAPCSAFRDEDISDDVQCALRIHEEHTRLQGDGFLAWVVYPHYCKHNAKKYLIDCDSSAKSFTKFDDRARNLKSVRNNTTPQFVIRHDIDELQPPYLAIKQLFKGNYETEFERNYYNNKKPANWLNFKINNIDELKLPDLSNNRNSVFTTPSTTTTIIDKELIGIKPPSPRKIESNQFRRRMMNLDVPRKSIGKSDYVPNRVDFESHSPPKINGGFLDLSHNPFINLKTIAKLSEEQPYTPSEFTSYTTYKNSLTTTPKPTTRPTTTERKLSHKLNTDFNPTTPNSVTSRRGKARYVPELSDFGYYKTTKPPNSRANNDTIINRKSSVTNSNDDIQAPETKTNSTGDKEYSSTETVKVFSTSQQTTTRKATTQVISTPAKSTPRPFTQTTSVIQTSPVTASSTTVISTTRTVTPAPTERSTQSIFDLYLNPTRATIKPFKFASLENSPFKIRIFSGGTTTPPPSFISKRG